jgi:hypothetical protein
LNFESACSNTINVFLPCEFRHAGRKDFSLTAGDLKAYGLDYAWFMEPAPPERTVEPEASSDGVDDTQILWMLSLAPTERLEVLQDFVDGALALRDGRVSK